MKKEKKERTLYSIFQMPDLFRRGETKKGGGRGDPILKNTSIPSVKKERGHSNIPSGSDPEIRRGKEEKVKGENSYFPYLDSTNNKMGE